MFLGSSVSYEESILCLEPTMSVAGQIQDSRIRQEKTFPEAEIAEAVSLGIPKESFNAPARARSEALQNGLSPENAELLAWHRWNVLRENIALFKHRSCDQTAYKQALDEELQFRERIQDPSLLKARAFLQERLADYPVRKELAGEANSDALFEKRRES